MWFWNSQLLKSLDSFWHRQNDGQFSKNHNQLLPNASDISEEVLICYRAPDRAPSSTPPAPSWVMTLLLDHWNTAKQRSWLKHYIMYPQTCLFPPHRVLYWGLVIYFIVFWTRWRLLQLSRSAIRALRGNGVTGKELTRASLIRWWSAGVFFSDRDQSGLGQPCDEWKPAVQNKWEKHERHEGNLGNWRTVVLLSTWIFTPMQGFLLKHLFIATWESWIEINEAGESIIVHQLHTAFWLESLWKSSCVYYWSYLNGHLEQLKGLGKPEFLRILSVLAHTLCSLLFKRKGYNPWHVRIYWLMSVSFVHIHILHRKSAKLLIKLERLMLSLNLHTCVSILTKSTHCVLV